MLLNVLQYTELPLQPRIIQPKTLVMPWLEGYSAPQPHHLPSTEINVTHVFLENNSLALLGVTSPLYTRFSINSCMSQRLFNEIIASSAVSWNKITPDILNKINNEKL